MLKNNNKGFFLIETLIVTTVVAMAMVFLYSQMSKLLDGYDLRLTYNTVDGTYATSEVNKYILNDTGKYIAITSSGNIASYGFVDVPCTTFTNATYCGNLFTNLGINKIIVTAYNPADIKIKAPTEVSFSDDLKLFISNITKVSGALATDYRIIVSFNDGSFATTKLNAGIDTIVPTITGAAVLYVISGETYSVSEGLVATDNFHGDISNNIVCVLSAGSTYNCTVKDSIGNTSATFARTITTAPNPATFSATGAAQPFTTLVSGYYKVELWGAQGGSPLDTFAYGGYGAYASGVLKLNSGTVVNVYVGGSGGSTSAISTPAGWNGGGIGRYYGGGGGGATDIRLGGSATTNIILISAGGGGGNGVRSSTYPGNGGYGGGTVNGGDGTYVTATYDGKGATQSAGGAAATYNATGTPMAGTQWVGGQGGYYTASYGAGGGGGGYYGGGGGAYHYGAGGGGSSWYSTTIGLFLSPPTLIAGNAVMPNWAGTGTITGNGNTTVTPTTGYAKFTFLTY